MCSGSVQEHPGCVCTPVDIALLQLHDTVHTLTGAPLDTMDTNQRIQALAAITRATRGLAGVENELIAGLHRTAVPAELGDGLKSCLAGALRITKTEAGRRISDAEDTATRTALTGEPLAPRFPATATALRAASIDRAHIREIHRFFERIPVGIPPTNASAPRSSWPTWPPDCAPTNYAKPPTRCWCSWATKTTTPTPTAPADAASPGPAKTSTA